MKRITRLTHSDVQEVTGDGEFNTLNFDTVVKAVPASTYKASDNTKIFVRQRGCYSGRALVMFAASDVGAIRSVLIVKNGTKTVANASQAPVGDDNLHVMEARFDAEDCAPGDFFQVYVVQDTGDPLEVMGGGGQDVFPGFAVWRLD